MIVLIVRFFYKNIKIFNLLTWMLISMMDAILNCITYFSMTIKHYWSNIQIFFCKNITIFNLMTLMVFL